MRWLWIDTCCIDKTSSAELSESINSLFRWYRNSYYCLAYLEGVAPRAEHQRSPSPSNNGHLSSCETSTDISQSVWFTWGWTLQELLAPRRVIFLSQNMKIIGQKGPIPKGMLIQESKDLTPELSSITKIPEVVLRDFKQSNHFITEQKLAWMSNRVTTRVEDMAYCLLGIFNVSMPIIYGEGSRTYARLLKELDASQIDDPRPHKRTKCARDQVWSQVSSSANAITKQAYMEIMDMMDDGLRVGSSTVPNSPDSPRRVLTGVLKVYIAFSRQFMNTERLENITKRCVLIKSCPNRRGHIQQSRLMDTRPYRTNTSECAGILGWIYKAQDNT